jgi:TorA maturation chaperone TorD
MDDVGEEKAFLESFLQRTAEDLEILARLHDREPDAELAASLRAIDFPASLTLPLDDEAGREARMIMEKSLALLPPRVEQQVLDELAADYASIYLNHGIGVSPLESVWTDEDGLVCQDSMFQVRQWYESHGLRVPDWRKRPDDHLVYQLQFVAHLLRSQEKDRLELAATFLDEHLLRWLSRFSERVLSRCETPWFAGVAAITAAYVEALRDLLAEILQQPRPSPEEIEERMRPKKAVEEVPVAFMPGMGPVV